MEHGTWKLSSGMTGTTTRNRLNLPIPQGPIYAADRPKPAATAEYSTDSPGSPAGRGSSKDQQDGTAPGIVGAASRAAWRLHDDGAMSGDVTRQERPACTP